MVEIKPTVFMYYRNYFIILSFYLSADRYFTSSRINQSPCIHVEIDGQREQLEIERSRPLPHPTGINSGNTDTVAWHPGGERPVAEFPLFPCRGCKL